jgi:hypothetical protein
MTEPALATVLTKTDIASPFGLRQLRIGLEYYTAGRIDEAIAAYQKGLAAVETESHGDESVETTSELYSKLGNACMVRGDLECRCKL